MIIVNELPPEINMAWQGLVRGRVEDLEQRRLALEDWLAAEQPKLGEMATAVRAWAAETSEDRIAQTTAYRRAQRHVAQARRALRIIASELARRSGT